MSKYIRDINKGLLMKAEECRYCGYLPRIARKYVIGIEVFYFDHICIGGICHGTPVTSNNYPTKQSAIDAWNERNK